MQRDYEFMRNLMFEIEANADTKISEIGAKMSSPDPARKKRVYHLTLLCDAGLLKSPEKGVYRMTNKGHDWIDALRDDTVWQRTQEVAEKVGGASLHLLLEIGTSFIKGKLAEIGLPLG